MAKFYKTVFRVTVLSERPISSLSLSEVAYEIDEGDCSGEVEVLEAKSITPRQCAQLALKQASDPGFFRLDANGKSVD